MNDIIVKLHPNSTKGPLVVAEKDGELTVYLREKPKNNEANLALIKTLAKHYKIPKTRIKIISGHKSRHKRIEIQ